MTDKDTLPACLADADKATLTACLADAERALESLRYGAPAALVHLPDGTEVIYTLANCVELGIYIGLLRRRRRSRRAFRGVPEGMR